jgi:hypothetical protein
MQAMIDMSLAGTAFDPASLNNTMAGANSGVGGGPSQEDGDFKGFDTAKAEFDHTCPSAAPTRL